MSGSSAHGRAARCYSPPDRAGYVRPEQTNVCFARNLLTGQGAGVSINSAESAALCRVVSRHQNGWVCTPPSAIPHENPRRVYMRPVRMVNAAMVNPVQAVTTAVSNPTAQGMVQASVGAAAGIQHRYCGWVRASRKRTAEVQFSGQTGSAFGARGADGGVAKKICGA